MQEPSQSGQKASRMPRLEPRLTSALGVAFQTLPPGLGSSSPASVFHRESGTAGEREFDFDPTSKGVVGRNAARADRYNPAVRSDGCPEATEAQTRI